MFDNTLGELAENKLLLLYILQKIKFPIFNSQLTEIVLENNFMNYFTFQQYISELLSSNFLIFIDENSKQRIKLTEKGIKVLELFSSRISSDKIEKADKYIKNKITTIKKDVTITADYTIDNGNSYIVNLKASENSITLMEINVNMASNKQARDLCAKWKENSTQLYNDIIKILIE